MDNSTSDQIMEPITKITDLPKIRTIRETYKLFKQLDPDTSVTESAIRRWTASGLLPSKQPGKKCLINFADLINFLATGITIHQTVATNIRHMPSNVTPLHPEKGIRPVRSSRRAS